MVSCVVSCDIVLADMRDSLQYCQATISVPCEGYYNRGVIALSLALSPLWFAFYLYHGHGVSMLEGAWLFYFLVFWGLAIFVAACVCRFAPGGESYMAMGVATPIALYGFIMAATWIEFIADALVSLLDFVGIVLHIPGSIMGLTILAWGNSMPDLSTNVTMARKGLANMAMTACFAGPVFNILIGLGLGFSRLATETGNPIKQVSLSGPVETGLFYIILNCVGILIFGVAWGKGRIPSYSGGIAIGLYAMYLGTSMVVEFSRFGNDGNDDDE
jgi:solute carrier family 24 (sodium/potassium/calcium exchanger), member 6